MAAFRCRVEAVGVMVLARSAERLDRGAPVRPMLARPGSYPADPSAFAFEPKWDGIRAIARVANGRASFSSRTGNDVTAQFPELAAFGAAAPAGRWVFDGEIVAPDEEGVPRFQRIQSRLGVTKPGQLRHLAEEVPVVFVIFDVMVADGADVTSLSYSERRALLEGLSLRGPSWFVTPVSVGDGEGFLALTEWEGVVAKRLASRYEPGARSPAWIKIRRAPRQEFVVGGWTPGRGSREGRMGALLVGYHDERGLVFAGSVGTGFTDAMVASLTRSLRALARSTSPFATPVDRPDARFVEPRLVAEVEFNEWTSEGRLRQPSFKGLRDDKPPADVVKET